MRTKTWFGLLLVGSVVALAAAVTFGASDQAQRLAEDAERLSQAERALSSVAVARSNLGIAVVLSRASGLDSTLSEGAAEAMSVTAQATRRLLDDASSLEAGSAELDLDERLQRLSESADRMIASAPESEMEAAATAMLGALSGVEEELLGYRDAVAARVEAEGGRAGDLARVASYTVALVAPAVALFAFRRISQRRLQRLRREEELRRREDIAAAKVDLVAGLSHELRTPLTGIHGFSHTLIDMLDGPADPDDRPLLREIAGLMVEQTSDLSRMVDDLISHMRITDGTMTSKPVPVDVQSALEPVLDEFAAHGRPETDLEPATLLCDPIHLRQMVRNLVSNATRHGGPHVRVSGSFDGEAYLLDVVDDGEGVPAERGDPFVAFAHDGASPLTEGSLGMGLGVVKGLAGVSGGAVRYLRRDGATVFQLALPLNQDSSSEPEDHIFATGA